VITVTQKSRCAVLALAELARRGDAGPVPILEVAEGRGIPLHFLEQLFSGLRRAGILQSQRGVKGGYSFRRRPADVTMLEVVEAVDGPLTGRDSDGRGGAGSVDAIWADARERVAEVLREVTIADVVDREARVEGAPMFYI
jgi:Rrf2 family protein